MHWIIKCLAAGIAGGSAAVAAIMTATLVMTPPVVWSGRFRELAMLFAVSAFSTGWAYYVKGPQQ